MTSILEEIRDAYALFGIEIDGAATYGTYYRIRCGRCGRLLGTVGDKLLPGMAEAMTREQFDLYATGMLGCRCGYQAERARAIDGPRAEAARARLGQ
ncbi:MAG TPA: hypothetical protein VJN94_17015 [Candidatus Binataceae bacterium]|nr:hypothetical protein [Candidatus Binataceae bacterium]